MKRAGKAFDEARDYQVQRRSELSILFASKLNLLISTL